MLNTTSVVINSNHNRNILTFVLYNNLKSFGRMINFLTVKVRKVENGTQKSSHQVVKNWSPSNPKKLVDTCFTYTNMGRKNGIIHTCLD